MTGNFQHGPVGHLYTPPAVLVGSFRAKVKGVALVVVEDSASYTRQALVRRRRPISQCLRDQILDPLVAGKQTG